MPTYTAPSPLRPRIAKANYQMGWLSGDLFSSKWMSSYDFVYIFREDLILAVFCQPGTFP